MAAPVDLMTAVAAAVTKDAASHVRLVIVHLHALVLASVQVAVLVSAAQAASPIAVLRAVILVAHRAHLTVLRVKTTLLIAKRNKTRVMIPVAFQHRSHIAL
jgi:hypothetical protein